MTDTAGVLENKVLSIFHGLDTLAIVSINLPELYGETINAHVSI